MREILTYSQTIYRNKLKAAYWMRTIAVGALASMVAACASIGRPEGGPRDETPPEFVRSNPAPGSLHHDKQRVDMFFNENIKLEDIQNKLVVSPTQKQQPVARANGRRLTLDLRDSLIPNTTYTIDFSDAIRDLNEGNILDGFAMDFSTGDVIDSLRISGMVFEARNLEPAQGMIVGVYSNLSDTAITTLPLERVAKTNQLGQFTIRGLKPGTYRIFALDDRNHDWHWDRSENVAFSTVTVSPEVVPVEVSDTLASSTGTDSIVTRTAYHYLPDDLLLTWFTEKYKPQYLRDYERTDRRRVTMKFGSISDTLPEITVLNGPAQGRLLSDISVLEARQGLDSLVYWIRDTAVVAQDSLLVSARYQKTDTLEQLVWTTDTLKLFVRGATRQAEKEAAKKWADEQKKREKEQKDFPDSVFPPLLPPVEYIDLKFKASGTQDLNVPAILESATPLAAIDSTLWRLEIKSDTLWLPAPKYSLRPDSSNVRGYLLDVPWAEETQYRFVADSAAMTDIYGHVNKLLQTEFKTKSLNDYGNIIFDITDIGQIPDSAALVVELLDKQDKPVKAKTVTGNSVTFDFVNPDTYYARAYIDLNRNGEWDTGVVADSIQPEDVFYYPKKLTLRKNWDIAQEWALFGTPVDLQKPDDIKKNKPKNRDNNRNGQDGEYDEEDEFYDESGFGNSGYYDQESWGNGAKYNNARRNNNNRRRPGGVRNSNGAQLAR